MKDLIVAATKKELEPFLNYLGIGESVTEGRIFSNQKFDLIITGIGLLATAYNLGSIFAVNKYNLILNLGIAGSFSHKYPIKSLVNVKEEVLADLGSEDSLRDFKDLFEMGLMSSDKSPFKNGALSTPDTKESIIEKDIPRVKAVSVNRVLAHEKSINWIRNKYAPDTVSMEGAAVFFASLQHHTPCIQIRTISDFVGTEDRKNWDIQGAIEALNKHIIEIYEQRYCIS